MDFLLIPILGTLMLIFFTISIIASRKVNNTNDYFLAGNGLSVPMITATLLATQVGGGMFLGTAQDPFRGLLYNFGMVFGFLFLGLGLASQLQRFKVTTIGEIFDKTYNSASLHKLTGFLSAISLCGIIISQIIAAKSVLSTFAGINSEFVFLLFWALVLGYTMIGGLAAVVIADFVQIIIIITVFSGICLYSLFTNPISFFTVENYSQAKLILTQSSLSWGQAFKILTMPIFFSIIEQDLAQRFFAAKTERTAALSAFFASILLLLFSFVPFYLGMQARLSGALIPSGVNPLLPILKTLTSPFVFVLALCALLSAITSTTDSLLCAVSAIITTMITRFNKSIKPSVSISRGVTLICGLLTLGASYLVPPNIIDILIGSYELSVSCLFVPLFFCFITKDLRREAALSSALFGAIGFLFFLTSNYISLQAYSVVITLGFSLLGYALGFALSSKKK